MCTQSCPALCKPMDCSLPDSSVHGIFQARILAWVAIPFSRGPSRPRDQTQVSCISRKILYHVNPRPKSHQFQFSHSVISSSATPWTAACQASLSITNSQSLLKLISIESVMPSNHLILCHAHLFLPEIFPSINIFSNELALCIRWPKYGSFSFTISPSN